jgi:hypothetical protein
MMTASSARVRPCKGNFFIAHSYATPIKKTRAAMHTSHITRQQRLHDQALDRANEQRCRRLVVKRGRQLAAGLAFLDETMQTFAVALNQGLHHALGRCRFGTLKLTKHQAWQPEQPRRNMRR